MKKKIIACEMMKEELLAVSCDDDTVEFDFISTGLHAEPLKLNATLQNRLDESVGYEHIVLCFGYCGGGAKNLQNGDYMLSVPKVHDCLAIMLGSQKNFNKVRDEEAGTLYFSRGWLQFFEESTSGLLPGSEILFEKYGEEKGKSLIKRMYAGYKRALCIMNEGDNKEALMEKTNHYSQLLSLTSAAIDGTVTYYNKIVNGPYEEAYFFNIKPKGILEEMLFLKME